MRAWLIAIIALAGLAVLFAVREVRLSSQIKSLQQGNEELTAQQQAMLERLDRIDQELSGQSHQNSSGARSISPSGGSGNAQVLQRLTALENQMRALQGRLSPE